MASSVSVEDCELDIESSLHANLYTTLSILALRYRTTKEFDECLKIDMFTKNNKHAFQHVIHFLLSLYNREKFNQTVIWPILDVKMEAKFRKQVIKYIDEIRAAHEDSGIPLLMTSHIISPGGLKIVHFLLNLSSFVLYQLMTEEGLRIGHHMKADDDDEIYESQLESLETKSIVNWAEAASDLLNIDHDSEHMGTLLKGAIEEEQKKLKKLLEVNLVVENQLASKKAVDVQMEDADISQDLTEIEENAIKCLRIMQAASTENQNLDLLDLFQKLKELEAIFAVSNIEFQSMQNNEEYFGELLKSIEKEVENIKERSEQIISGINTSTETLKMMVNVPTNASFEGNTILSEKIHQVFKKRGI